MRKLQRKEFLTSVLLYSTFFVILVILAALRAVPGYMDEAYYLVGARNLSNGIGFEENLIWNFMDDPEGLPHPSHLYWMPLVSILSASGMAIFGHTYLAGCIPQALIGAFIAPCVYLILSRWLKDQFWAVVGGVLAGLGGYYLAYYSAGDAFSLYMILGYGYFAVISKLFTQPHEKMVTNGIAAGIIAGLMHLTRADGLLWALMIPVFISLSAFVHRKQKGFTLNPFIISLVIGMGSYFLVMSPWYLRNLQFFGTLTAKGSSSNLFLTTYNDLYSYPSSLVTRERWLNLGLMSLIGQRLDAAGTNLLSLVGVQMLIIQLPFVLIGIWRNWKSVWVKVNLFGLITLFMFFTVVFPMAGMRGGFFHSGTVFQIFLWCMAIYGLRTVTAKLPLNEGIKRNQFEKFIGIGFLVITAVVTGVLLMTKLGSWPVGSDEIEKIGAVLDSVEVPSDEVILINDPATFNWVTERPVVVIPSGDEKTMLSVMDRYDVNYVVMQINHPPELSGLYLAPQEFNEFSVIYKEDDWFILRKGE